MSRDEKIIKAKVGGARRAKATSITRPRPAAGLTTDTATR